MTILGLALAALVGVALGLLGGGGSTLAVPILVYVAGMPPKPAIAVSLLVVGTTSLVGALRHWRAANVDARTGFVFGLVSMAGSYTGGRLAAHVPDRLQLAIFAVVMLVVSVSMLRGHGASGTGGRVRTPLVVLVAAGVGLLTGVVGVGGGFLIVPALVLFAGLSMKRAVGTSLLVIALNSITGFAAYAAHVRIDWRYAAFFTLFAVSGVFLGTSMMRRVSQTALRRGFALFLIVVAAFILVRR